MVNITDKEDREIKEMIGWDSKPITFNKYGDYQYKIHFAKSVSYTEKLENQKSRWSLETFELYFATIHYAPNNIPHIKVSIANWTSTLIKQFLFKYYSHNNEDQFEIFTKSSEKLSEANELTVHIKKVLSPDIFT